MDTHGLNSNIDEKLITEKEAAQLLNKNPKTLYLWRRNRVGPTYTKLPTGSILYRLADLRRYIKDAATPSLLWGQVADKRALGDQLEDLLGLHRLTRNKDGELVPLADKQRVTRHSPTLPLLTAEQEAELFAPVDTGKMKRMAMLQPKSKISRELDQIKNNNNNSNKYNNKNKNKSLDMRLGGIVRKSN